MRAALYTHCRQSATDPGLALQVQFLISLEHKLLQMPAAASLPGEVGAGVMCPHLEQRTFVAPCCRTEVKSCTGGLQLAEYDLFSCCLPVDTSTASGIPHTSDDYEGPEI
jgi:hypothetical protein